MSILKNKALSSTSFHAGIFRSVLCAASPLDFGAAGVIFLPESEADGII